MTSHEIDFTARARLGLAKLEAYAPGCTDAIALDNFDVGNSWACPLARTIGKGNYGRGAHLLGLESDDECAPFGFSLTDEEYVALRTRDEDGSFTVSHTGVYALLTEAWRTVLTAHRAS